MKYYQQILKDESSVGAKVKRVFQVIGLAHFLLALIAAIYCAFIYWVFLILPAFLFVIGIIYGCLSYLFSKDYMYEFCDGEFAVSYKNSYNKYVKMIAGKATAVDEHEGKVKKLTNKKEGIIISLNGNYYKISPDGLMQTLIRKE